MYYIVNIKNIIILRYFGFVEIFSLLCRPNLNSSFSHRYVPNAFTIFVKGIRPVIVIFTPIRDNLIENNLRSDVTELPLK